MDNLKKSVGKARRHFRKILLPYRSLQASTQLCGLPRSHNQAWSEDRMRSD